MGTVEARIREVRAHQATGSIARSLVQFLAYVGPFNLLRDGHSVVFEPLRTEREVVPRIVLEDGSQLERGRGRSPRAATPRLRVPLALEHLPDTTASRTARRLNAAAAR